MVKFAELVTDVEPYVESIDLNPVMCTADKCFVAAARMMLKKETP